jgi:hypothetical protein
MGLLKMGVIRRELKFKRAERWLKRVMFFASLGAIVVSGSSSAPWPPDVLDLERYVLVELVA